MSRPWWVGKNRGVQSVQSSDYDFGDADSCDLNVNRPARVRARALCTHVLLCRRPG
jgi:hypothetical protein